MTVNYVVDKVDPDDLKTGNWGGKIWQQLKQSNAVPPWRLLCMSKVWTDVTKYSWLHKELKGETARAQAVKSNMIKTQKGQVKQCTVKLSTNRSKSFMWGPVNGVTHLEMPAAMWIECTGTSPGCASDVLEYIKENPSVAIICIGELRVVNSMMEAMEACADRRHQNTSLLHVGLDRDNFYGAAPGHHRDQLLSIFLCTPIRKMNQHYTVLSVRGMGWRTSLIDYCLAAMGISMGMGVDYDQNLVCVPHPMRSPDEVMDRVSYLLTINHGLSVSLVPPTYLPPDENTVGAMLTNAVSEKVNNEALMRQHENDLKIFNAGKTLDALNLNFKSDKELRDDIKRELVMKKKMVQEEMNAEGEHQQSENDEHATPARKNPWGKKKRSTSSGQPETPASKTKEQKQRRRKDTAEDESSSLPYSTTPPSLTRPTKISGSREELRMRHETARLAAERLENEEDVMLKPFDTATGSNTVIDNPAKTPRSHETVAAWKKQRKDEGHSIIEEPDKTEELICE